MLQRLVLLNKAVLNQLKQLNEHIPRGVIPYFSPGAVLHPGGEWDWMWDSHQLPACVFFFFFTVVVMALAQQGVSTQSHPI